MSRWLSRYWLLIPLIMLTLVVRDWVETPSTVQVEETIDMRTSEADYYLEDFTTKKFDSTGKTEYIVRGETLSHYPASDSSEILAPEVELHRPEITWQIRSARGKLEHGSQVFTLQGDVTLQRRSTSGNPMLIRTEDLSVLIAANEVRTEQAIEIIADNWKLSSVGLQSAIDEGKLTLLSNVTGHFNVASPE
ncbi:MAG: LPS export ABC transporter periplasmic protein LptC [Granulosicoccus sp.]